MFFFFKQRSKNNTTSSLIYQKKNNKKKKYKMLIKTEKLVHIKKNTRSFINVVREHYLRDDIPCKSASCTKCEQPSGIFHLLILYA